MSSSAQAAISIIAVSLHGLSILACVAGSVLLVYFKGEVEGVRSAATALMILAAILFMVDMKIDFGSCEKAAVENKMP